MATASVNTLTDQTKDFISLGVMPGRDYLYLRSGDKKGLYAIKEVGKYFVKTEDILGEIKDVEYSISLVGCVVTESEELIVKYKMGGH